MKGGTEPGESGGNGAPERLLAEAMRLLKEGRDPESIGARELTEAVPCALGLLNYHFGNRDALIRQAAERLIVEADGGYFAGRGATPETADRAVFLAAMVNVAKTMVKLGAIGSFAARQALLKDDFALAHQLLPSMGAGPDTPAADLVRMHLRALHFLAGLQAMLARRSELAEAGIDLSDEGLVEDIIHDLAFRILS